MVLALISCSIHLLSSASSTTVSYCPFLVLLCSVKQQNRRAAFSTTERRGLHLNHTQQFVELDILTYELGVRCQRGIEKLESTAAQEGRKYVYFYWFCLLRHNNILWFFPRKKSENVARRRSTSGIRDLYSSCTEKKKLAGRT